MKKIMLIFLLLTTIAFSQQEQTEEQLLKIYVKAYFLKGLTGLIPAISSLLFGYLFLKENEKVKKHAFEIEDCPDLIEYASVAWRVYCVLWIVMLGVTCFTLVNTVQYLTNPEWYAIKELNNFLSK